MYIRALLKLNFQLILSPRYYTFSDQNRSSNVSSETENYFGFFFNLRSSVKAMQNKIKSAHDTMSMFLCGVNFDV